MGKRKKAADGLENCAKTRQSERKFRQPGENGQTARAEMEGESREKGREGAEGRRGAVRRGEARQPHGDTAFCSVCALVWHGKSPLLTSDGGPRV